MTDDQIKMLDIFESRVRHLMYMCDTLRSKNAQLESQLSEKSTELEAALDEIKALNAKYDNLKIARVVSIKQGEIKNAKQRLSKLVREVDKCISLLNE